MQQTELGLLYKEVAVNCSLGYYEIINTIAYRDFTVIHEDNSPLTQIG